MSGGMVAPLVWELIAVIEAENGWLARAGYHAPPDELVADKHRLVDALATALSGPHQRGEEAIDAALLRRLHELAEVNATLLANKRQIGAELLPMLFAEVRSQAGRSAVALDRQL